VTTLIQRMREDLVRRNYAESTIRSYQRSCSLSGRFLGVLDFNDSQRTRGSPAVCARLKNGTASKEKKDSRRSHELTNGTPSAFAILQQFHPVIRARRARRLRPWALPPRAPMRRSCRGDLLKRM
jgi:hypothetical protein